MNLFFVFIFLLFNLASYSFAQITGKSIASCSYLSQKIYCFGGAANANDSPMEDSNFVYLDIVKNSGSSYEELATQWTTIPAEINGSPVQARGVAQSMVLPDGKTMILSGGWSDSTSPLILQTLAYNANKNSWSSYPSYKEPPFGVRQIYRAASVYVPDYGVGFYGGQEAHINQSWTYQGQNMSHYNRDYPLRAIGYTSLTFFDIRKSLNPWTVFPTQNNLPTTIFPFFQTSIFDTLNNKIFFFGGQYRNTTTNVNVFISLRKSTTFDVISGTWGSQDLGGESPQTRIGHTTTLLSSTNRDVLLYGGKYFSKENIPCRDYLYTLNLDSYEWKSQRIPTSDKLIVARFGHSAVPVRNDTLFILFGKGSLELPMSSMVILNVTDPSSITHLETYVDPNEVIESSSSPGLSKGTTVGIAVGVVVGGLIIITAIFCVWKKNKDTKKKEELKEIQRQNERIEEPIMEVNWDMIDQNFAHSPHSTDGPTTVLYQKKSEFSPNLMPVRPDIKIQRPDAIDGDFTDHSIPLHKPYGGH